MIKEHATQNYRKLILFASLLQSLQTEIENQEPCISLLVDTGKEQTWDEHLQSEEFKALIKDLLDR